MSREVRGFYDVIRVERGKCPLDCRLCEQVCAEFRGDQAIGPLKVLQLEEVGFHELSMCRQCSRPACRDICLAGAIVRDETSGVVRIMEDRCVGCGLCTLNCPHGGIRYSPARGKAIKCDLCGGDPKCVSACPHGLIALLKSRPVQARLHQDRLSPTTPLCPGCGVELGLRLALKILGPEVIAVTGPGCGAIALAGTEFGAFRQGPAVLGNMTNLPAIATGIKRYYSKKGREVICTVFAGDGLTADIGFQPLSGAAERGENLIYICLDNEAYMNTGIQRSSTTPLGAWTSTTPLGPQGRGKAEVPKYMPLIMAFHGIPYAATASVAFPEDLAEKLNKAKAVKDGLAYIHLLAPCPTGWRSPSDLTIELARKAVETNYFPLWEDEHGRFRLTHRPDRPRPIEEFARLQGRFGHLTGGESSRLQEFVDRRLKLLESLAALGGRPNLEEHHGG